MLLWKRISILDPRNIEHFQHVCLIVYVIFTTPRAQAPWSEYEDLFGMKAYEEPDPSELQEKNRQLMLEWERYIQV